MRHLLFLEITMRNILQKDSIIRFSSIKKMILLFLQEEIIMKKSKNHLLRNLSTLKIIKYVSTILQKWEEVEKNFSVKSKMSLVHIKANKIQLEEMVIIFMKNICLQMVLT